MYGFTKFNKEHHYIIDDHKNAVGVFMDIKKAFDTIDHNILQYFSYPEK